MGIVQLLLTMPRFFFSCHGEWVGCLTRPKSRTFFNINLANKDGPRVQASNVQHVFDRFPNDDVMTILRRIAILYPGCKKVGVMSN